VIRSFGDKRSADLYHGRRSRAVQRLATVLVARTQRKLDMMEAAVRLDDLRSPPGNRLEALGGDRKGWHSVRVNDQWRLVFRWMDGAVEDVTFMDYH